MTSKDKYVVITKDILIKDYLRFYNKDAPFDQENINRIFSQGDKLERHFSNAPSTAMSFSSIISGSFPYELGRKTYVEVKQGYNKETIFDKS
jgi:arylsulfatase A-like enzyme